VRQLLAEWERGLLPQPQPPRPDGADMGQDEGVAGIGGVAHNNVSL